MIKATKIALLYWLRQALRLFCPHKTNDFGTRDYNAKVCPTCALWMRVNSRLDLLCGWKAHSQLRKCALCFEPLPAEGTSVHLACAERENALAAQ